MQRWASVGLGALFVAIVGAAIVKGRSPSTKHVAAAVSSVSAASPVASASTSDGGTNSGDSGFSGKSPGAGFGSLEGGVPELPANAPKAVSFGVILFMYQGSETAPKDALTREQALERARAALAEARTDFAEAAKKGDRGSTADAGRIPRGVLEPAVEYALFTLEKGEVYDEPIDTPRGFWVIKRIH